MIRAFLASMFVLMAHSPAIRGQSVPLRFKQERDGAAVQVLTAADFATLGDPLFNLLLAGHADTVTLSEIEQRLQPDASKRPLFVVSEDIVRSSKVGGRRVVLAFDGTNAGEDLKGNVMLSLSFGPNTFPENGEVEGWGWDNHRQRYNYYKLDATGTGTRTWKFRGSSVNADLLSPAERTGTCMRCHVVGAPVMKELALPWNNWHAGVAGTFVADYLVPGAGASKWPVSASPRLARLTGADKLETDFLVPAFKRFNESRLNSALKRDDTNGNRSVSESGLMTVLEGRRLLRPLFETVEINLSSSRDPSGIHPFGKSSDFVAAAQVRPPFNDTFFLNAGLIAGGGVGNLGGLNLTNAREFRNFVGLTQQENKDLVDKFQVRVDSRVGDTHFAWITPEPAFVDNNLIDQCLRLGVVTRHFLASALAIDLEAPVFSTKRAELLQFVPDRFEFTPIPDGTDLTTITRDPELDLLTKAVVAAIDETNPPAGSPADEFRLLLKSPDAVAELKTQVDAYVNRVKADLDGSNSTRRKAELERLYKILLDRRRQMLSHPVLGNLDETNGQLLLPMPTEG